MMPNTAVDIVVILIILLSAGLAFVRGFAREAISMGTWFAASYLGFTQYQLVMPYLEDKIHNEMIRQFASGVVVFLGVLIILIPIGMYIRSFIKGEHVTSIDRSFGFLFGAARGYLLLSIIYLIISWLLPEEKQPAWLKEANTKPILVYGAELTKELIPKEQLELMEKKAKEPQEKSQEPAIPSGEPAGEKKSGAKDMLQNVLDDIKGKK